MGDCGFVRPTRATRTRNGRATTVKGRFQELMNRHCTRIGIKLFVQAHLALDNSVY